MKLSMCVIDEIKTTKEYSTFMRLSEEDDIKAFMEKTLGELHKITSASAVEIAKIIRRSKATAAYKKAKEDLQLLNSSINEKTKIDKARLNLAALALILQQEEDKLGESV